MLKKLAATAAAGTIAWAGISAIDNTTRDDSGQIVTAGDLGAFVTKSGDCLNGLSSEQSTVDVIQGVPCTEAHHWQVIYKDNLNLSVYSKDAISQGVDQICTPIIDSLINGLSDAQLEEYKNAEVQTLQPTSESWAHEDRVVDCLIGSNNDTYFTSILE
jgi:hypothetical protein